MQKPKQRLKKKVKYYIFIVICYSLQMIPESYAEALMLCKINPTEVQNQDNSMI